MATTVPNIRPEKYCVTEVGAVITFVTYTLSAEEIVLCKGGRG